MKGRTKVELVSRLKRVSFFSSITFGLIGLIGLIGWLYDLSFLKKVFPDYPPVAQNTSILLLLASIAVLIFLLGKKSNTLLFCGRVLSGSISIFGFLTLIEYVLGVNIGIDQLLLFAKHSGDAVRMSPQSAFIFFMLGLSLIFISQVKTSRIKFGQLLVLLTGEIALLSLFGYIYDLSSFYTIVPHKGMAIHTALSFVLVFIAVLTMHPEIGVTRVFVLRSVGGIAARQLLMVLTLIVLSEILISIGQRLGFYDHSLESLIHLIIVASAFLYLIISSLKTLGKLAEMEISMAQMRQIDRAKTDFVSMASHQLRTPLTSVAWFAEMLLRHEVGPLNQKQVEYLHEIFAGNRRMIDLVDDLLNASRIDMGMLAVEPETIEVGSIVKNVLLELNPTIVKKKIEVVENFSADLPKAELDPELTRVIIQNLLSNAVKYTGDGGKIEISMKSEDKYLQIAIADSGFGIQKNQQNKVFTKLFRADNIRDKVTDGTGLGLYIVKAIIKQFGGKIKFISEEGKGTTFFVRLPLSSTTKFKKGMKIK